MAISIYDTFVSLSCILQEGDWTDDELSVLAKAIAKFPGGIPGRWVKIANMVGRSVSEVSSKDKTSFQAEHFFRCCLKIKVSFVNIYPNKVQHEIITEKK